MEKQQKTEATFGLLQTNVRIDYSRNLCIRKKLKNSDRNTDIYRNVCLSYGICKQLKIDKYYCNNWLSKSEF